MKDLATDPVQFVHKERNWKVKLGADSAAKNFMLFIDGVLYEELPDWQSDGIYRSST